MNEAIIHIRQLAKQYKDSDFYAVHPMDLTIRNFRNIWPFRTQRSREDYVNFINLRLVKTNFWFY